MDEFQYEELDWSQLSLTRFYASQIVLFTTVRGILFPNAVVKTHIQLDAHAGKDSFRNTFARYGQIVRSGGVRALWKGFPVVAVGMIPGQFFYTGTLEMTKYTLHGRVPEFVKSFLAGTCAMVAALATAVPTDVISQRFMVQDSKLASSDYGSISDAFRQIYRRQGLRGFYKGSFATLLYEIPLNGTWWGVYGITRRKAFSTFEVTPGSGLAYALQAICGIISGYSAVLVSNPIDVVKTHIQVKQTSAASESFIDTFQHILRTEGLSTLLFKGVTPRLFMMIPFSALGISTYEFCKEFARIEAVH